MHIRCKDCMKFLWKGYLCFFYGMTFDSYKNGGNDFVMLFFKRSVIFYIKNYFWSFLYKLFLTSQNIVTICSDSRKMSSLFKETHRIAQPMKFPILLTTLIMFDHFTQTLNNTSSKNFFRDTLFWLFGVSTSSWRTLIYQNWCITLFR